MPKSKNNIPVVNYKKYCNFCGFNGYGGYTHDDMFCWCDSCFDKMMMQGSPEWMKEFKNLGICLDCIKKIAIHTYYS